LRKVCLLLILIYGQVFALEKESTLKMYDSIFSAFSLNGSVKVYTNDKEYREVFGDSKRIILSNKLEESDIALITDEQTLQSVLYRLRVHKNMRRKPVLFVTNYQFLKMSDDILGAFYWRKGRSQLLFIKKRLQQHNITLPQEYQNFIIDTL